MVPEIVDKPVTLSRITASNQDASRPTKAHRVFPSISATMSAGCSVAGRPFANNTRAGEKMWTQVGAHTTGVAIGMIALASAARAASHAARTDVLINLFIAQHRHCAYVKATGAFTRSMKAPNIALTWFGASSGEKWPTPMVFPVQTRELIFSIRQMSVGNPSAPI